MAQNFHVACRQVAITNVLGLHLRAADRFVRLAQAFQSDVKVRATVSWRTAGASWTCSALPLSVERCWLSKPTVLMPRMPLPL